MMSHGVVVVAAAGLPVGLDPGTDVPVSLTVFLCTLRAVSRHAGTRLPSIEVEADVPTREGGGELKVGI